ncbi:MAG: molecular chaperone TorD family protein, partial [Bacillota bacterium]
RREYTRLFTHPLEPKIGICEALFNNRGDSRGKRPILFVSPSALSAEHCYQKAGLIMTNAVNEPGDHMAIEMEFMMYLFSEKAKALHFNNQEKLLKIDKGINEFSEKHLKKWAVSFFENCASLSNNEFYRIFGEVGSIFLTKVLNSQM